MNDVSVTLSNPYSMASVGQINIYSKGLHVGDTPQLQIGRTIKARLPYDFDPATRTDLQDKSESYRIPPYYLVNPGASWSTCFRSFGVSVFFNVNNVLDSQYIERGKDGPNHTESTFTGYWACGRNFNFVVRLSLNRNHHDRHVIAFLSCRRADCHAPGGAPHRGSICHGADIPWDMGS